jgi:L-ascorbate metabolism protein UlaG (beta-lactamase superfamily)
MLVYTGFAIALVAFIILSFFNKAVFGAKPNQSDFESASNFKEGIFHNISETNMMSEDGSFFKILGEWFNKSESNTPKDIIPIIETDLKNLSQEPSIVWFGHSTYLLKIDGKLILVDPVFNRASPVPFFGKPYAMSFDYDAHHFPEIDYLVITHDHYDHLDYETFKTLIPQVKQMITSAGVEAHLKLWGAKEDQICSLNWQQSITFGEFNFTALTARHFSGRKFKRSETLWSSFVLKTPTLNIYLGGDSGFDTHFEKIGKTYGPFDVAILECGQYGKYWPKIHMVPSETYLAAKQLGTKKLFTVHWGKFSLSTHGWKEPITELFEAQKEDENPLEIITPQIGEVYDFTLENYSKKWWEDIR